MAELDLAKKLLTKLRRVANPTPAKLLAAFRRLVVRQLSASSCRTECDELSMRLVMQLPSDDLVKIGLSKKARPQNSRKMLWYGSEDALVREHSVGA